MSFLYVFISCFVTSILILGFGNISNQLIFKFLKSEEILETSILGIIFISIFALFSNFFINLNIYFNSIVLVISLIFLKDFSKIYFIKILKYSALISTISFLTIIFDNINRPDAGLYHLPFVKILNDFPIIIGLANINDGYGITSIIQYLSAINLNFITGENGVLIPLVTIYSIVILFFFEQIFKKENENFLKIFSFLIFSFILLNMNRYSGFGNDAPAHMFYFLLIFYFLKSNDTNYIEKNFRFVTLISLYTFLIKPFFILSTVLALIFIINKYKLIKIFNFYNIFLIFIFFAWIFKNILITGCMIYPLEISCFNNISWVSNNAGVFSLTSEAWAKGWPDRENKSLAFEEYLINFNWISTWASNHLNKILEKFSFFLAVIILFGVIISIKNKTSYLRKKKELFQLIIFNLIFIFAWFLFFPIYRFGFGIIATSISLIFIYIFYNKLSLENKFFYKSIKLFIIILCVVILSKNIDRIFKNFKFIYIDYPWPKKNSSDIFNKKVKQKIVIHNNQFLYFKTEDDLCYYNKSPCTHKTLDKKIIKGKVLKYYDKFEVDNKSE